MLKGGRAGVRHYRMHGYSEKGRSARQRQKIELAREPSTRETQNNASAAKLEWRREKFSYHRRASVLLPRAGPRFALWVRGLLGLRAAPAPKMSIESPLGPPAFQGFLYKRSEWLQVWRKRFFKLYLGPNGPRIYFCNDKDATPHGVIDLRNCLTVKTADEKTGKTFSFEVATGDSVFFMHADSAQEKDEVRQPPPPPACAPLCAPLFCRRQLAHPAPNLLPTHALAPLAAVGRAAGPRNRARRQVARRRGSGGGGGGRGRRL